MDNSAQTPSPSAAETNKKSRKPYAAPEVRLLGKMSERTLAGAGSKIDSNTSKGHKVRVG
jgi:hypothetical protein